MRPFLSNADRKTRKEIIGNSGGLCQIFPALRSKDRGKKYRRRVGRIPAPPAGGYQQKASTGEAAAFLEQDFTTVPNFALRLILSCGNLVGVATPSPPFFGSLKAGAIQNDKGEETEKPR